MYYNRSLRSTRLIPNSHMQQPLFERWQLEIQHKQHAVLSLKRKLSHKNTNFTTE